MLFAIIFALTSCDPEDIFSDTHVHAYGEWYVEKDPTCTTPGLKVRDCSCGDYQERKIEATGHKFGDWTVVSAPECEKKGTERSYCSCGEYQEREVSELGHAFGDWTIVTTPECEKKGIERRYCTCGESEEREIPEFGHTFVIDSAVAPTCYSAGLTEGRHCSVCNKVTIAQVVIQLIPHTYDSNYDPECNVCGFTRDVNCPHKSTSVVKGYPPTCTATGLTDGEKCTDCGKTMVLQIEIDPLDHISSDWLIDSEPSYVSSGKMHKECLRCGKELETKETPKLEVEINGDFNVDNNGLPNEIEAYIGTQTDNLELTNSINVDNKYYIYYFYLGTINRAPLYSTPSHKYTFDTEMTFEFQKLTSEQITESQSKATERVNTHSYTGGFSIGFEQKVELGAEFCGADMNLGFTTSQSTDHHWTNNWGTVVTNSTSKENSYLTQNMESYKYTYQVSEQNGFKKGYYYRATFYENVSVYGVLIYDATSQAETEVEKYTVVYQTFLNSDQPTYVLEESADGTFTYTDDSVITFDVDKAINIASNNKPTNVQVSTSYIVHITNVYDMYLLSSDTKGKTFILDNDIDFAGIPWVPINNFEGTFDGNGHCISNLKFELYDGAVGEWGLFKTISSNGVVKNLTIKNCTAKYLAPDMGYAVSNVKFGFLATYNYGEISNCTFNGNNIDFDANTKVTDQYVYCGIAVCENYGYIRNSTVSNNSMYIDCDSVSFYSADDKCTVAIGGGICAYNQREGYISECTSKNNVINTRVCYLADKGETVISTSSGAAAWNYGHLVNNTCEENDLTAIKRYYKAHWSLFGDFKGTEYEGQEKQSCDQECTRNYGN